MTTLTCPRREELTDYLAGSLPRARYDAVTGHVDGCADCQKRMDHLAQAIDSLHADLRGPVPSGRFENEPERERAVARGKEPRTQQWRVRPGSADLTFLERPIEPSSLGRLLHYDVSTVIGQGGFGIVVKAFDTKLHRTVAIKALAPHLAGSAEARHRFLREARTAAAVVHANVVAIHAVEDDGPVPYLAMEYVEGLTLGQRIDQGPLGLQEIVAIGLQIARGLAAAHDRGLIHRDIKPANILIAANPEGTPAPAVVKITDFGLARAVNDTGFTQSGVIAGTPSFMAPEQAAGQAVDHRADLFSFGSVLYAMCTGKAPFCADNNLAVLHLVAEGQAQPLREVRPDLPKWLAALIARLHAKNPAERYPSAHVVAEVLARHLTQAAAPLPVTAPAGRGSKRWPKILVAAALGFFACSILAWQIVIRLTGDQGNVPEGKVKDNKVIASGDIPLAPTFTNSLGMQLVLIGKGKFWMGGEGGKRGDKEVHIPNDFYLGVYEVTQEEWQKVMDKNPSCFRAVAGVAENDQKRFPVEYVSWDDTQRFLEKLNKREKTAGWEYRLPREAEWEYACRGGPLGNPSDCGYDFYGAKPTNELLPDQANFKDSMKGRTCKVGSYPPNRLGLYDMHGNVWEWCDDAIPAVDNAMHRTHRGGGSTTPAWECRAAHHGSQPPAHVYINLGLRLARVRATLEAKETNRGRLPTGDGGR